MSNSIKDALIKAAQKSDSGVIEITDMIDHEVKLAEQHSANSEDNASSEVKKISVEETVDVLEDNNLTEEVDSSSAIEHVIGEGLVINVDSLFRDFAGQPVIINHFDSVTGEPTTTRINNPAEMIEILVSNSETLEQNLEKQEDAEFAKSQIPILMDNLANMLIIQHGLQKVHEGDILHLLAERQMLNSVLKELFQSLGFPLEEIRFAPTPFKTAFGGKMLSMQTIYNGARHIIVNHKLVMEQATRAIAESKIIKNAEKEILEAADIDRQKAKVLRAEAEKISAENQRAVVSFNTPATEKPFVLRGSYLSIKKAPKGEKVVEQKRIVYVGVKKNAKYDTKSGLPFSKYLFATTKMEQAVRFQSARDAKDCFIRLEKKFKADALNKETGFNAKKMAALRVTRIIMEALV